LLPLLNLTKTTIAIPLVILLPKATTTFNTPIIYLLTAENSKDTTNNVAVPLIVTMLQFDAINSNNATISSPS
jgi:hypothetical protein